MIEILLFFIGASLLLYVLLGGADYGAGILELLPLSEHREEQKKLINQAMGPVWEANHMWLILIVVILFMGFPLIFTTLMTSLHLPMVALLVGIVARGCAFTFRHYDAVQEPRSQKIYSVIFGLSSLWTSVWLGIIVASLNRGKINPESLDFYEAYVAPWWGLFPLVVGIFVTLIFAFLASVYLVGETKQAALKRLFLQRALVLNVLVIIGGGLVFLAAARDGGSLPKDFISHNGALVAMILATSLFFALWTRIRKTRSFWIRLISAGQITLILCGWVLVYAPQALMTVQGPMTFYAAASPPATLFQLVLALVVGSLFIFPSLFYLLKVFKF